MDTSPIDSWESVAAYFTFADSPAMTAFLCALAVVVFVAFLTTIIRHENHAFEGHRD